MTDALSRGLTTNVGTDPTSPLGDAFGRLRTAEPFTVFDSKFQYDTQAYVYEAITANSGTVTHDANTASAVLTTAAVANSQAQIQSRQYWPYIPGKSHLVELTTVFGAAVANIVRQAGYNDDNDGIFLEQNGTTDLAWVRRTSTSGSPVDNRVVQASWNIDKMDGTGPSGLTLDMSKSQILVIDLQWLGVGRVRVGFGIDGQIYYVHQFLNANSLTVPYMKTASLPVRWRQLGNGVASMRAICATVQSEGGADSHFSFIFAHVVASVSAGSGTQTLAFNLRAKTTYNSITNRQLIRMLGLDLLVTGSFPVIMELYHNTSVGGAPSWADLNALSGLQIDTAGTSSGGIKIAQLFVAAGGAVAGSGLKALASKYPIVLDAAGTGFRHMTVYVTGVGGASACRPGFSWEEIR